MRGPFPPSGGTKGEREDQRDVGWAEGTSGSSPIGSDLNSQTRTASLMRGGGVGGVGGGGRVGWINDPSAESPCAIDNDVED